MTALSPNNAVAGGPDFTLIVMGSGFASSSVIQWNGANRATTLGFLGLSASISANDIAAAGTATVTVVNPSPGGGTSNPLIFTIHPPPAVTPGGVVGAASFTAPLVAGSIGSVFGTNLAGNALLRQGFLPPQMLGNAWIDLDNQYAAPLFFTSASQINFQVPWELVGNSKTSLTVTNSGVASNTISVDLADFNPGIFTLGQVGQGAVLIAGSGEVAGPTGSIPGQALRPANRGEYIAIYCTGLGAVTNPPRTGAPASANPVSVTLTAPGVTIGGQVVPVTDYFFSGLAPGFVGLYQVTFKSRKCSHGKRRPPRDQPRRGQLQHGHDRGAVDRRPPVIFAISAKASGLGCLRSAAAAIDRSALKSPRLAPVRGWLLRYRYCPNSWHVLQRTAALFCLWQSTHHFIFKGC